MKKSELYNKHYIDIFCPSWTEYLWDIISIIKNSNKNISNKDIKKWTLNYIEEMLENNLIHVGSEWDENKKLVYWNLPNNEILEEIDKMWFDGADYPDFIEMCWFIFKDWYIETLKANGFLKERILWKDFIEENIGDLEKWINDNKPHKE